LPCTIPIRLFPSCSTVRRSKRETAYPFPRTICPRACRPGCMNRMGGPDASARLCCAIHSNRYDGTMSAPPSVFRYRIRNWREYNRALINRGRLTVWFDEQTIVAWHNTEPAAGPGAPRTYSDLAIECALIFKSVYRLSLRAAQGFLSSVMELRKLTVPIPDYSTVSRRQRVLSVRLALTPPGDPRHIIIDATGLRVFGAGEWQIWKHHMQRRRTWRKLHLGIDEATKEIVAVELTTSRVHDSPQLPSLLDQIRDPIDQVSGDGAYDTRTCYE